MGIVFDCFYLNPYRLQEVQQPRRRVLIACFRSFLGGGSGAGTQLIMNGR